MSTTYRRIGLIGAFVGASIVMACNKDTLSRVEGRAQQLGAPPNFTLFETGQVRPLALSPNGKLLFATNTPAGRLEIFKIKDNHQYLKLTDSVPVGLEPIAVAARNNHEVWVVNHLSDSISILRENGDKWRVVRTLLVGDEPRDIVFAGPNRDRAFITTAHRGQNSPLDPQLTTPGVGRADIWVFDAWSLGTSLGGTPTAIVQLFADTPRALAVSPDGTQVYAAAFMSGNRTTTIHRNTVGQVLESQGGPPAPNVNHQGITQPLTGLIVRHDGQHWVDETGRNWDSKVNFNLPDKDVFAIDAMATPPAQVSGPGSFYTGVGTTIFNMAVNPATGTVYVSNTDARNHVRFSGPGTFAGSTVRGHLVESRITVLKNNSVLPRHLNKHINYSQCCADIPNEENDKSLAFPLGMAVSNNGATLYVAAIGSDKVGVFATSELEMDTFTPSGSQQVEVSGGGPTGLVLDEPRKRLYVLTRFDNAVSIIDTNNRQEIGHIQMLNPEPASVIAGRRLLYDARHTSSHGDSACASCHIFGDMDHIAWDLGDPDGDVTTPPGPFKNFVGFPQVLDFHPMKGPMMTQSLRGLANHGPMHWRGDRSGGFTQSSAQPDQGSFDERAAFIQFNEAFMNLQGRSAEISQSDMEAFADFALQVTYPPNPVRALDNSLTAAQQSGHDIYFNSPVVLTFVCQTCHKLDRTANAEFGVDKPGFFGTDGHYVGSVLDQPMKVPHFRNLYQKVGMFGMVYTPALNEELDSSFAGDQIRGFGFIRDGSIPTVSHFLQGFVDFPEGHPFDNFNPGGFPQNEEGRQQRRNVESFLLAYDSNLDPVVGQQITLTASNAAVAGPRIDLLLARALAGECEVVVHSQEHGYLYSGGVFYKDRAGKDPLSDSQLRATAAHSENELTYTCVPVGSGRRLAIDRNLDGVLDGDE